MPIQHVYSQTVADGTATSVVRPSDWNSNHRMVYNLSGNTTGSSQISGADITLVGGNDIFLSADTAGSKLVFSFVPNPINSFDNMGAIGTASGALGGKPIVFRSLSFFPLTPMENEFVGNMTLNTIALDLSITGSTATLSGALSSSASLGLYTINSTAGSYSIGLVNSVAFTFGLAAAATNNSTAWMGQRFFSAHSSQWSSQPVLSYGVQYVVGLVMDSGGASSAQSNTVNGAFMLSTAARSGFIGQNIAAATWQGFGQFLGIYTATTNALPAQVNYTQINKQSASANFVPHLMAYNYTNLTAL